MTRGAFLVVKRLAIISAERRSSQNQNTCNCGNEKSGVANIQVVLSKFSRDQRNSIGRT